ncbi:MAG TPA: pitrilysin family protein [Thermoanaerobaculia bacterium]|nr:pitrilysin family protein [Thermoanaerobaculia bacterium]
MSRGANGAPPPAPAADAIEVPRLLADAVVETLANGLTVCRLSNRQAPVVTTALWYRAGTRHETAGHGGVAHFLEHMMFKGSPLYPAGAIDRRTQALGGDNNAFTSHDATAYYFNFAPDRWREALAVEADRMASLVLAPDEVASERRVILEEIALYDAAPWDALETRVMAAFYGAHPYGRPVLGTRADLEATGPDELAAFHRRFYRPGNAVLVIAGDVGEEAGEAAAEAFSRVPDRAPQDDEEWTTEPAAEPPRRGEVERVEQRKGEVPRLLLALPAPPAGHPDQAALRLATVLLGSGRASRLHRLLVDERQLCVWVDADLSDSVGPGHFTVALELVPGVDPAEVEALVLGELERLAAHPPSDEEVERARRIAFADWVFAHERIHQQALTAGYALALFDLGHAERQLAVLLAAEAGQVTRAVTQYLLPEAGGVAGWSLPAED